LRCCKRENKFSPWEMTAWAGTHPARHSRQFDVVRQVGELLLVLMRPDGFVDVA
jgi:hypothetical protein